MTSNYTHLTTLSTTLQLSPPISVPGRRILPLTMVLAPGLLVAKRRKRRPAAVEIRRAGKGMQQDKVKKIYLISFFYLPCLGPDYPEDPYYHGLSARVPVFGGSREKEMRGQGAPTRQAVSQGHWWQDRMYPSGELFLSFFNPHNSPSSPRHEK